MGRMLHIKGTAFDLLPEQKVIKAEDYAAYKKADEIIVLAQKEADRIQQEAKLAFEEEKKRGYKVGTEEGSEKMSQQMMESVSKTVDYFANFEEKLVEIVIKSLEKIIGEFDRKDLVTRIVRHALAILSDQKQVTLKVASVDYDNVKGQLSELLSEYKSIEFIDLKTDERLNPGDCILETEMGVVDASIGVQLNAIRKSLLRTIR